MPQPTPTIHTPNNRLTQILWLIGCLLIGFAVGNIFLGLPFAALLYYGVPDSKLNERWPTWRRLPLSLRAVILLVAMYLFLLVFLATLGPWLTAGMGQ